MNSKKGGGKFEVPKIPEKSTLKIPSITKNPRKNNIKIYKYQPQRYTSTLKISSIEPISYSNYELLNLYIK